MDVPLSKIHVVFLLAMSFVCYGQTTCILPQPGRCSSSNFTINSNEVCDVEAGSCDFSPTSGMCSYRQGCADPHMTNWTLEQGYIQAEQTQYGSCGRDFYYSVLESPWLNISHPSCLKVRYRRIAPTALDVFLELCTGHVLPLLNRSDNADHNKLATFKTTVDPGVGKILLRAYGGGGSGRVVIYIVTLEPGSCTWSGELTVLNNGIDAEQQTSPLISPAQDVQDRTDCLQFSYTMDQPGSWLAVSIQLLSEERRTVIWNCSSSESRDTDPGSCPIQVRAPFKIIFTGYSPDSEELVKVSSIVFSRWPRNADCSINPMIANTSATDTVIKPLHTATSASAAQCASPSTSSATASLPTTTHKPTTKPALFGSSSAQSTPFTTTSDTTGHTVDPFTDDDKDDGGKGGNSYSALIPGVVSAVAAVIVIIIIIVVVILIRRRRRLKRKILEPQDMASDDGIAMREVNGEHEDSMMDDAVDVTVPSHYDAVGELSPPNPYSSLQVRQCDVTSAPMTSAAPSTDVNRMEVASYYNVGGQARSEANCYYNVGAPVPLSVKEDDDGYEVPVSKVSMGFRP